MEELQGRASQITDIGGYTPHAGFGDVENQVDGPAASAGGDTYRRFTGRSDVRGRRGGVFTRGVARYLLVGVTVAGCAAAGVGGGVSARISPARVMVASSAPVKRAAATGGTAPAGSPHAPQPAILQLLSSRSSALMPNGLALTPPMGWNGYNHFGRAVTAAIVEAAARAMVTSGMKAAGYTYVNLDGGWNLRARSARGQLQPNPRLFPHGIQPVIDYVHSLGLKFGIYASAGTRNCAGSSAGSYGHYRQDAATFASWGVDYIKLDWCYLPYKDYPSLNHQQVSQMLARQMGQAIAATGRRILYDVNDTVIRTAAWTWGARVANVWRTTPDIRANYTSMVTHFIRDVRDYHYAGRGGWNDPDMLEVGQRRDDRDRLPNPVHPVGGDGGIADRGQQPDHDVVGDAWHPDQSGGHRHRPGPAGQARISGGERPRTLGAHQPAR